MDQWFDGVLSRQLAEERGKYGDVGSGGNFTPQVGIDHPAAGIHGRCIAEVVRRVENGPGRLTRKSLLVLA